jgi:hypothetical protein
LHNKNNQFIGNLNVGSDSQEIKTIFSTATGLTWLMGESCSKCNVTNKFNPSTSASYNNLSDSLTYGVKYNIKITN